MIGGSLSASAVQYQGSPLNIVLPNTLRTTVASHYTSLYFLVPCFGACVYFWFSVRTLLFTILSFCLLFETYLNQLAVCQLPGSMCLSSDASVCLRYAFQPVLPSATLSKYQNTTNKNVTACNPKIGDFFPPQFLSKLWVWEYMDIKIFFFQNCSSWTQDVSTKSVWCVGGFYILRHTCVCWITVWDWNYFLCHK